MYEQLTKNERLDKVVEMIDALRSEVVGIKNDLASTSTSTETVEETDTIGRLAVVSTDAVIIEHKGLKLRKVDREAREGDYVKIIKSWNSDIKTGGFYKIELNGGELVIKDDDGYGWERYIDDFECVENYEVIDVQAEKLPFPDIELTANQQRAALIEKAKKFVEVKIEYLKNSTEVIGGYERKKKENPNFCGFIMKSEFVVNSKKRTVVCLLKLKNDNAIKLKGIAKCDPNDVFNEHIGQAIALARAFEIDVPREFLEAVQPDDLAVGQVTVSTFADNSFNGIPRRIIEINDETIYRTNLNGTNRSRTYKSLETLSIIDDTDAQYGVI